MTETQPASREARLSKHGQAARVAVGATIGSLGGLAIETPVSNILMYLISAPEAIAADVAAVVKFLVTVGLAYLAGFLGYAARDRAEDSDKGRPSGVIRLGSKVLLVLLVFALLGCMTTSVRFEEGKIAEIRHSNLLRIGTAVVSVPGGAEVATTAQGMSEELSGVMRAGIDKAGETTP